MIPQGRTNEERSNRFISLLSARVNANADALVRIYKHTFCHQEDLHYLAGFSITTYVSSGYTAFNMKEDGNSRACKMRSKFVETLFTNTSRRACLPLSYILSLPWCPSTDVLGASL